MMHIHWLQHVPFEGLGSIEGWATARQHGLTATRLWAGDALPAQGAFDMLIIMGGPMSIHEHGRYPWLISEKRFIQDAIRTNKRVLGICLGAQLIADVLGAEVKGNRYKEIGWFSVETTDAWRRHLHGQAFPASAEVFHWHGETFTLPAGAVQLARSEACDMQAFVFEERVLGLQFHLETTRESARSLIENCAHELIDGPYVQSASEMLQDPRRFMRMNHLMTTVLDGLTAPKNPEPLATRRP